METNRNNEIKHVYVRERQTDDVFRFWKAATVDEIQPVRLERERVRSPYAGHSERKFFKSSATFALLLISTIFAAGIATTHQTLSYFNDLDSSNANSLNAGILDLEITDGETIGGEVTEGDTGVLINPALGGVAGSFDMKFKVRAEKVVGNDPFCNLIQAQIGGDFLYSGPLVSFTGGPSIFLGVHEFNISLPDATGVVNGDSCQIDLVYTAWAKDAPDEQGYVDEERVHITLTATGLPEQAPALFNAFGLFDTEEPSAEEAEKKLPEEGETEETADENRERGVRDEREDRPTTEKETPAEPPAEGTEPTEPPAEPKPEEPPAEQEPATPPVEETAPPVVTEEPVEPAQPEFPAEPVQPEQPPAPEIPPIE